MTEISCLLHPNTEICSIPSNQIKIIQHLKLRCNWVINKNQHSIISLLMNIYMAIRNLFERFY